MNFLVRRSLPAGSPCLAPKQACMGQDVLRPNLMAGVPDGRRYRLLSLALVDAETSVDVAACTPREAGSVSQSLFG